MENSTEGLFIALEGIDGSGKTTQTASLLKKMISNNCVSIAVNEPGTSDVGIYVREYLKSNKKLNGLAELFLFAAARAQLVDEYIRPNVKNGIHVITDRYYGSSVVYQGFGRLVGTDIVDTINAIAVQRLWPDVTFYLNMERPLASSRKNKKVDLDKYDTNERLQQVVWEGYKTVSKKYPDWVTINVYEEDSIDMVTERMWDYLKNKFQHRL